MVEVPGRDVDIFGRGAEVPGRDVDVLGRDVDVLGRDVEVRDRDVEVLGRGAEVSGRDVEVLGRGAEVSGRDVEVLGRGAEVSGRDVEVRDRDPDAVVVGAGHNGLVCAAYLARAGLDTIVVEARDEVGGCASTVTDLDARFNICSCDHTMVRTMPFMEDLNLSAHGLRYVEADPSTVYLDHNGSPPWLFFNDRERTVESIARHRPDQAKAYSNFLSDARPVAELTFEMSTGAATTGRMLARLLERRARGALRLWQWSRASALDVLGHYFDDEALIMAAISNGPTVWGVAPDQPGTGMVASLYALRHMVKSGRPVGGSGALTDALASAFQTAGGRLQTGKKVERLLGDGRVVRGVRLTDETEVAAATVVVACDPGVMARHWLPDPVSRAAKRFVGRARSQPVRDGYQSKIDAVITDLPCFRALEESSLLDLFEGRDPNESTFVVSPSVAEVLEAHRLRGQGRVALRPTFMSNVASVLDPMMRSRDGHHVLSLETLFTPYALEGGWENSSEPARWLQVWSGLLQPGFVECVDRYRTMTPDRYERELFMSRGYTPSYGGSPLSTLLGRKRELSRHRGPLKGLFLSGAATFPGAGVWGAAGHHTATTVLRSLGCA